MAEQEERDVCSCFFTQCSDLVVEAFDRKAIDAVATREAESFVVYQVNDKSIKRELHPCFEENILALGCSMCHPD